MAASIDDDKVEQAVKDFLLAIGEDPTREGLRETPARVARATHELLAGMDHDGMSLGTKPLMQQFQEGTNDLVIVRDISFYSFCEHHLLPFFGKAHIAYLPREGKIVGLSKLARCVNGFARRLQVQERLTKQIADALEETLKVRGCMVILKAEHMCMTMRGVSAAGSLTTTMVVRGELDSPQQVEMVYKLLD